MDHIRDWFFYRDIPLTDSEWNLVLMYQRLSRWHDHSVYKNAKGEILPEILEAMLHIDNYSVQSSNSKQTSKPPEKQWFDL